MFHCMALLKRETKVLEGYEENGGWMKREEVRGREGGERWGCSNSKSLVMMVITLLSFVSFFQESLSATEKLKQYIDTLTGKLSSVSAFLQ